MTGVRTCPLPEDALLRHHRTAGAHVDCYATETPRTVSQAGYVEAFYTTPLFRSERLVLRWLASLPSTDVQARQLAAGASDTFAAWRVEARTSRQLLLRDVTGRTRSWLMTMPLDGGDDGEGCAGTRLYFGSAIVPVTDPRSSQPTLGFPYRWLLGAHAVYSRRLLRAARSRLESGADRG